MVLVGLGFLFILLVDLPPIIRRKSWRELAVFFLLFIPALILSILLTIGAELPSILLLLGQVFKNLGLSYK